MNLKYVGSVTRLAKRLPLIVLILLTICGSPKSVFAEGEYPEPVEEARRWMDFILEAPVIGTFSLLAVALCVFYRQVWTFSLWVIRKIRQRRKAKTPTESPAASGELSPSPKLSAAPSVAGRSFLEFLNDLPDASRLAFVYATASSEKRIDFYRDDARQEFIVSHRLHGKVKPVFFKLPAKEYRELLANIQDAEKQGFIAKQRLKSRDDNDEDYVIQASCERKSLQCFIDDELRKEFAKFPSLVWTVLEAVCAAPGRMLGIDESDRVRLFRGCYVGDELDAPSLEKAPRKDLEDAVCFLIAREGLEKRARFDSLSFYAPLNQSYLLDELRRERFSNAPPFRKPSRKFWQFWRRKR